MQHSPFVNFATRCTIHKHASCLPFHPNKFSQATLLSLILLTIFHLQDCSLPKSQSRKIGEREQSRVDRQERGGEGDCLARTDFTFCRHGGLVSGKQSPSDVQREVREPLCTGHVSLFSLVSFYIMYKQYSDAVRPQLARAMRVSALKKLSIVWTSSGRS